LHSLEVLEQVYCIHIQGGGHIVNSVVVDVLEQRFPNHFSIESENGNSYIKFPAKSPEFGEMVVFECEEYSGEFIIYVGNFTHYHMDLFIDGNNEMELANRIADLLEDVFNDQIICHGAHKTGGGFDRIDYFIEREGIDYFTWSGKYIASRL